MKEEKSFNGNNGSTHYRFGDIITNVGIICPEILKYYLKKYAYMNLGDGMRLKYVPDDDKALRVCLSNGNWFNVVKNYSVGSRCNWKYIAKQVRRIVCTHYNVPSPDNFPSFNDWTKDLYENGFCNSEKRWAKLNSVLEPFTIY